MDLISPECLLLVGGLLLVYYRVPGKRQWLVLLTGSALFYLSQGLSNLLYILFTALSTYAVGVILSRTGPGRGKPWLTACLTANFAMLFVCKVRLLQGGLLPLGISFYLFQSMGYLLDVYRGKVEAERNFARFALFIAWFPQLIQGPISRFTDLAPRLTEPHPYDGRQLSFGAQRMLWGLFKKLVVGDRAAIAVGKLLELGCGGTDFLLLSSLYALQIYGDFTGGIDLVLGLSECFGIRLPENFCRPFFSKNVAQFWRRWHITLGEWMKDYIFFPVSVSKPLRRLSRAARKRLGSFGKRLPVYAASLATWFVTGIWHGLTPNFVIWGMLNCAVIVLSGELTPLYARFHARFHLKQRRWYGGFEMLRTFLLMNCIRIVDLFPDVWDYFGRLTAPARASLAGLGLGPADWTVLLLGCTAMLLVSLTQEKHGSARQLLWQKHWLVRYSLLFLLGLAVLLMGCYGIGYDAGSFIYSQF